METRFAVTGTLKNTFVGNTPLARLSIGITGTDGTRSEIQFVRDAETTALVAQLDDPEPRGEEIIETFGACREGDHANCAAGYRGLLDDKSHICNCPCHSPAQPDPTDGEINEMYLVAHGWEKTQGHGEPPFTRWEDPYTGGYYFLANALVIQEGRDLCAGISDSAGSFVNDETPLGELYGGE